MVRTEDAEAINTVSGIKHNVIILLSNNENYESDESEKSGDCGRVMMV